VLADMPDAPLPLEELLPLVSGLILSDLFEAGLAPDDTLMCHLARVAAIAGNWEQVGGSERAAGWHEGGEPLPAREPHAMMP
jgi:hypothetical protein